jgi:hypothetical protein
MYLQLYGGFFTKGGVGEAPPQAALLFLMLTIV